MSETNPKADRTATAKRLSERLSGFVLENGMSGADARAITDCVIASEP
ncbi:hypothetical protein [Methylobacterium gossipiicola]|uniref:Uncharacterized protein n=1 Tax=Methylobacterium gossipiicola TaxID=582675 RepID=A0A1I2TKW6_9HYPH|nr:hypothetical protein [Methylobacterium gossipiicola]SFG62991.1 hypothetical protein SAMN05192565_1072 [Methylobacterium gossipiicola]